MFRIPESALLPFRDAGLLVIPATDPQDQSISYSNRGKKPPNGYMFRRMPTDHIEPYERFHNAAWVARNNVVIDVDPKDGGIESLKRLNADLGIHIQQACAGIGCKTGGGGAHFYFSLPDGLEAKTGAALKKLGYAGIDVKSGNGYVIIPGCQHVSGGMYTWLDDNNKDLSKLQPIPPELYELIRKDADEDIQIKGGIETETTHAADLERARVLVAEYEGAGSGERNEMMFRLAARLMDFGLGRESTHEHLAVANDKNHPAMSQTELWDITKKALRYRGNDFGAMSVQSEFEGLEEIDISVNFEGQRVTPEEARAQLSQVTGRDEAISMATKLATAYKDEDWDQVAALREVTLTAIANSDDGAFHACKAILTGRGGVIPSAQYENEVKSRSRGSSEDLPEAIGMSVLSEVYGGQKLRYTKNAFFVHNPNMWHRIEDEEVKNHILNACNRIKGENPELGFGNEGTSNAALSILKSRTHVRAEDFFPHVDRPPARVLNCKNAELWFDDTGGMEVREASPGSRMFHSLNVEWDPEADCPTYKRVLAEVFQKCEDQKGMMRHHLEMKGYHLSPLKPLPVIEVCVGSGANGKSLLNATLMSTIMGGHSMGMGPISMFRMDVPSTTARLENKLIWIDGDLDANKPLPTGLLKTLSENITLTVEPKFMGAYNIMNLASWCLLSNELPISRDASKGLQRRIYCFPYDFDFEAAGSADMNLAKKLFEERNGIFRLWVEGLQRMLKRGNHFDEPDECVVMREEWMAGQNMVGAFVDECCVFSGSSETYIKDLYAAFVKFATRDGTQADQVMKQRTFTSKLRSMGGINVVRGTGNNRKVIGMRLDGFEPVEQGEVEISEGAEVPEWLA